MDQRFVTHAAVRHGRLGFFKAWHHRCKRTQATHTAHLVKLHAQVVHVELTLGELLRHCLGLIDLNGFGSLFNQADTIAHAENTASNATRMEGLQSRSEEHTSEIQSLM